MPRSPWYTIDPRLPTLPATATSTSSRNRPKIDDEAAAAQPFYFFFFDPIASSLCHSLSPPVLPSLFPETRPTMYARPPKPKIRDNMRGVSRASLGLLQRLLPTVLLFLPKVQKQMRETNDSRKQKTMRCRVNEVEQKNNGKKENKKVVEIVSGTLLCVILSRRPPQTGKGLVASRVPRGCLSRMLCFCGFVIFFVCFPCP